MISPEDKQAILSTLRSLILELAPKASEKRMYGGWVYELSATTPKRLFCGVFVRNDYVTIEFDRGCELEDKQELLEGSGKFRRHLKLHQLSEIKTKQVEDFIEQSYELT